VHRLETGWSAGGERVGFEIALGGFGGEVLFDELLRLEMARCAVEAFGCNLEELRKCMQSVAERGGAFWSRGAAVLGKDKQSRSRRFFGWFTPAD
jgi:hypothetical protein